MKHQPNLDDFDFTGRLDAVLVRAEKAGEIVHAKNIEKAVRRILRSPRPQPDVMLFLAEFIQRQERRKPGSRAGTIMLTSWPRSGHGTPPRAVVCTTTGEWFPSITSAAESLGCSKGNVSDAVKKPLGEKLVYGLAFRYAEPHEGPGPD
jgi:hypothetical protein